MPLNFLNPRPGTPFAGRPLVEPLEAIRWIALFRLGLPSVILRYAGGREVTLRELQALGLTSGINALIVGNYLTDVGSFAGRGPPDARRPGHADRRPVQGDLSVGSGLGEAVHCTCCGTALASHPTPPCSRPLEPPRFCPTCGRRLRVQVHPTGWDARCRDHGVIGA